MIASKAGYRRADYRFPRNSREAGIEHLAWTDRLKPLRSFASDLLCAALMAWIVFVLTAAAVLLNEVL